MAEFTMQELYGAPVKRQTEKAAYPSQKQNTAINKSMSAVQANNPTGVKSGVHQKFLDRYNMGRMPNMKTGLRGVAAAPGMLLDLANAGVTDAMDAGLLAGGTQGEYPSGLANFLGGTMDYWTKGITPPIPAQGRAGSSCIQLGKSLYDLINRRPIRARN